MHVMSGVICGVMELVQQFVTIRRLIVSKHGGLMSSARKPLATAALACLAAAGLLAVAVPASAADGDLTCDGGPRVACDLVPSGSGESWTINGAYYSAGDGKNFIIFGCVGYAPYVTVIYTDTTGTQQTASATAICSSSYQ